MGFVMDRILWLWHPCRWSGWQDALVIVRRVPHYLFVLVPYTESVRCYSMMHGRLLAFDSEVFPVPVDIIAGF